MIERRERKFNQNRTGLRLNLLFFALFATPFSYFLIEIVESDDQR